MFLYKLYYSFVKTTFIYKILSVIIFGIIIILSSAPFIGLDEAYRSFAEFSSIPEKGDLTVGKTIIALALSLSGFFIFSLVIAIFLQWREQSSADVINGRIIYSKTKHILILNVSDSIWYTLEGLNKRQTHGDKKTNVLILLHTDDLLDANLDYLRKGLSRYQFNHLNIDIKASDFYKVSTYLESNAHKANSTIVLSSNKHSANSLKSDNFQLLITNMLCSINEYKDMLDHNLNRNRPHKAIAQYQDSPGFIPSSNNIQCSKEVVSHFKYFNSQQFNRKLLSVAMIDSNYLQLFNKIFVEYKYKIIFSKANKFNVRNMTFLNACGSFSNGSLIGCIKTVGDKEKILINPINEILSNDMQLIFLCKNIDEISFNKLSCFKNTTTDKKSINKTIFQEMKKINLLIIGNSKPLDFIDDYLDESSIANKKQVSFNNDYSNVIINPVELQEYDTVILNINDDYIYRYFLMMMNSGVNAQNVIVNINDEDVFWSLKKYGSSVNQKLNIVFQKMYTGYLLEHFSYQEPTYEVYDELLSPRGNEFYFLDNTQVYSDYSLDELKNTFLKIETLLVGFLMNNGEIKLINEINDELSSVTKFIVISNGDI